jgi:hypothetical protein
MNYTSTTPAGVSRWLIEVVDGQYTLRAGTYNRERYNYGQLYIGRKIRAYEVPRPYVEIEITATATYGVYHVNRKLDGYTGTHEICDESIFTFYGFAEPSIDPTTST